jgi:hypothetical protein
MILNPYRFSAARDFGNASRDFDGTNDTITIPDEASPPWQGAGAKFSAAIWVKGRPASNGYVLAKHGSGGLEWHILVFTNGTFRATCFGALNASSYVIELTTATPINDTTWTHVGFTFDETQADTSKILVYTDGALATTTNTLVGSNIVIQDGNLDVAIGADSDNSVNYDGLLADARIYDGILAESDFADLHAGTDVAGGLWGRWIGNDDIVGSVVDDLSGNGRDGTNNGSIYSTDGPLD